MAEINLPSVVVEVDPNSHLSTSGTTGTYQATATNLAANEVAYQSIDYTAGHFNGVGGFQLTGIINFSSAGGANYQELVSSFSATLAATSGLTDALMFELFATNHANVTSYIGQFVSGSFNGVGGTVVYTTNTEYSFQFSYSSALSQYGTILWLGAVGDYLTYELTIAPNYRYLLPIVATNVGTTGDTVSGYLKGLNLNAESAGLDLTTLTETDASGYGTPYANSYVVVASHPNAALSLVKDYGASYFNATFSASCALWVKAITSSVPGIGILCFTNTATIVANDSNTKQLVQICYYNSTLWYPRIAERSGGTLYTVDFSTQLAIALPYWVKLERTSSGTFGTLVLSVYYDAAMTNPVSSSVSLALHSSASWRYFNAVSNGGSSTTATTFTLGGVSVNTSVTTLGSVSFTEANDSAALSGDISPTPSATITLTEQNDIVSITGNRTNTGTITVTEGNDLISILSSLPTNGSILFLENNDVVSINCIEANVAATEVMSVRVFDKSTGQPITGLTTVKQQVTNSSTRYLLDFIDGIFKSAPTYAYALMSEVDATYQPGLYACTVTTSTWTGWYVLEAYYVDSSGYRYSWLGEAYYLQGVRTTGVSAVGGSSASPTDIANAVGSRIISGTLTADQSARVLNALMFGKVSGAGTSVEIFRDPSDTKDVCSYHVDTLGNRTLVVIDPS